MLDYTCPSLSSIYAEELWKIDYFILHVPTLYRAQDGLDAQRHLFRCLHTPSISLSIMLKGRRRWFAQFAQKGEAPRKYEFQARGQVVGLNIGLSTIATVANNAVALERFA